MNEEDVIADAHFARRRRKKRDKIACVALGGILAGCSGEDIAFPEAELAAKLAYEYADAMLKASQA